MPPSSRSALVLYASETGNAQDLAVEVSTSLHRLHFIVETLPFNESSPADLLDHSFIICTISTTGQGEIPRNAQAFWKKLLRKKLPPDLLKDKDIAIYGLGDSAYPRFNWAALKFSKRFRQLGANELLKWVEGDLQHPDGYDSTFLPWQKSLEDLCLEKWPLPDGKDPIPVSEQLQPQWILAPLNQESDNSIPETQDETFQVKLVQNKRVTSESHFQDVRHIILEKETLLEREYVPGDIVTIYPENPNGDVNEFLQLMDWTDMADEPLQFSLNPLYTQPTPSTLRPPSLDPPPQKSLTLRTLLTSYIDLNSIPRRSFFSSLLHYTNDETQRERLLEFANPDLTDELYDYTTRPRRSILEVLMDFNTVKVPFAYALDVFPIMKGRQFSIASGGEQKSVGNKSRIDILIALVSYKTIIRKIRQGTVSRYLSSLEAGCSLRIAVEKGSVGSAPLDLLTPLVLVAPGTGVAPMRSLIWERATRLASASPDERRNAAPILLLFGSRSEHADFYFSDEWKILLQPPYNMRLRVVTAFSRDQTQKVYVQDTLRERGQFVFTLLNGLSISTPNGNENRKGIFYVCGSSGKMPLAVREALVDIFAENIPDGTVEDGKREVERLEKEGRWIQETW